MPYLPAAVITAGDRIIIAVRPLPHGFEMQSPVKKDLGESKKGPPLMKAGHSGLGPVCYLSSSWAKYMIIQLRAVRRVYFESSKGVRGKEHRESASQHASQAGGVSGCARAVC